VYGTRDMTTHVFDDDGIICELECDQEEFSA